MEFKAIPKETLAIIPKYDGEENLLNLFISKCEYILSGSVIVGNSAQNLYLFHAISSRLTGRAATLLSDHPNITSYEQLKELLTQHFGDPRSEECIAIELETLKLKQGETYIQFCHRIQNVRSSLFAKVNRLTDEGIKAAKMIVYNNTSLNVFLYNLPEDMIRIVRLKGCSTLENALSIVTEEVNFKFQYDAKNKLLKQTTLQLPTSQSTSKPIPTTVPQPQGFKPAFNSLQNNNFRSAFPQTNFKFGIPQNQGAFKPNFIQQMRFAPPTQGYRFGTAQNLPQRNFGQAPAQRAPFQYGGYKFGIPQQQGFKFGIQNQPQQSANHSKFGVPRQVHDLRLQEPDATMRTAPVRQNMIANDLYYMEDPSPCQEFNPDYDNYDYGCNTIDTYGNNVENECHYMENIDGTYSAYPENTQPENICPEIIQPENFQETASKDAVK